MTTRQISRSIAKWRVEQRRKKIRVLCIYLLADLLLLSAAVLSAFGSSLALSFGILGLSAFGVGAWYSYNAFWKDETANALLKRLERMKK